MRTLRPLILAAVVCAYGTIAAYGADIKIIANPSIGAAEISADELKGVFLLTKASLGDGSRAEPVLEKGGAAHQAFLKQYLGKTEAALDTYYRSLVFTGKGSMPKVAASDAEMAAYVAKTKGAVGYVSAETDAPGVKTLQVK
jgi:hypothetical protein